VDLSLIRSIIFQEAVAVTIYNPGHLLAKLEADGFLLVKRGERDDRRVLEKQIGDRVLRLENLGYYFDLAGRHLWRDEAIVDFIRGALRGTEDVPPNSRIELRFEHLLAPPGTTGAPK
jgi:hypothetical protein